MNQPTRLPEGLTPFVRLKCSILPGNGKSGLLECPRRDGRSMLNDSKVTGDDDPLRRQGALDLSAFAAFFCENQVGRGSICGAGANQA